MKVHYIPGFAAALRDNACGVTEGTFSHNPRNVTCEACLGIIAPRTYTAFARPLNLGVVKYDIYRGALTARDENLYTGTATLDEIRARQSESASFVPVVVFGHDPMVGA